MKLKFDNKLIPSPVKVDNTEIDPFLQKFLAGEEQRITEMASDLLQNPEEYGYDPEAIKEYINDPIGFNYDFGYAMGQDSDTREGNVSNFREFVRQNAPDPNFADAFEDDYVSEAIENFHKELYNKTRKK
jgi:hypothetical protein